jgi:hypothetical protein
VLILAKRSSSGSVQKLTGRVSLIMPVLLDPLRERDGAVAVQGVEGWGLTLDHVLGGVCRAQLCQ